MYNNIKKKTNKLKGGKFNNTKKNTNYKKSSKPKHSKMTAQNKDYTMLTNQKGNWVYKFYNKEDDDTITKSKTTENRCMCVNYKSVNDFQTYDRCKNKSLKESDFCELHQNCRSYLRNFLSGYEPEYQPTTWSDKFVEGSHNCYSYFLNRQVKAIKEKCNEICAKSHKDNKKCPKDDSQCTDLKPQPGDFELIKRTGSDKTKERIYKCPNMQKKILSDNPTLIPSSFNIKCPKKYYKGAMVVDPDNTYHFYRNLLMRDYLKLSVMKEIKRYNSNSSNNKYTLKKWMDGHTGYPIIDSIATQLKNTGFISEKARFILASFLINDLNIDLYLGVEYFKYILIDYDYALNLHNWEYLKKNKIYINPIKQAILYDKDCEYIKKWLPELNDSKNNDLHNGIVDNYYPQLVKINYQ